VKANERNVPRRAESPRLSDGHKGSSFLFVFTSMVGSGSVSRS